MIKIGLIGTQSMHAWSFAKECNIPDENENYLIPDCRVAAACGLDDTPEHVMETAEKGKIECIVNRPEELFDICDAVMVTTRRGDEHVKLAVPFLKRGIPVFIDKPVCTSEEDIQILKKYEGKCVIAGGSGMKHNKSLLRLCDMIKNGEVGEVKGISLNHNADIDSPYNGIFFYACHGVEIMLKLLGGDIKSIEATALGHDNFSVYVKYDNRFANLIFTLGYNDYFVNVYGDKKNISYRLDPSDIFRETMIDFAGKIRDNRICENIDEIVRHVHILKEIEKKLLK